MQIWPFLTAFSLLAVAASAAGPVGTHVTVTPEMRGAGMVSSGVALPAAPPATGSLVDEPVDVPPVSATFPRPLDQSPIRNASPASPGSTAQYATRGDRAEWWAGYFVKHPLA